MRGWTSDRSAKARRLLGPGLLLLSILPIAAASGIAQGAVSGQTQEPLGRLIADACEDGNPFNLQRIHGYNSVNLRQGYPMIEIRTPREVLSDE